ncbi:MAG: hypothetical protein JW892_11800, partial [Anaerolineae bacterium]|nr:hypothetical protein [Anaerolineae bacterium]
AARTRLQSPSTPLFPLYALKLASPATNAHYGGARRFSAFGVDMPCRPGLKPPGYETTPGLPGSETPLGEVVMQKSASHAGYTGARRFSAFGVDMPCRPGLKPPGYETTPGKPGSETPLGEAAIQKSESHLHYGHS